MRRTLAGLAALVTTWLMTCGAPALAQDAVKIGFVTTLSGSVAVVGNDMRDAFELALDHMGRKMAGRGVTMIYEDDALKPEQGKQKITSSSSPTASAF